MSYNTILSLPDDVNQLNLICKNLAKIQQLWEERLKAPHSLYCAYNLISSLRRGLWIPVSVLNQARFSWEMTRWRDWLSEYGGTVHVCTVASSLVFERQLTHYKSSSEFLYFLTFIINPPKILQFSNLCLNLPKKAYRKVIICNSSNEDFLLCLFLFSYVVLTHTGLVSTGN